MTFYRITPVQGTPPHVMTWDRYQDGRIRVSIIIGSLALTMAVIAMFVAFRRPPAATAERATVCPECPSLTVPACPTCPSSPPCPACPPCPSPRPNANPAHRNP